jgi:hypothetical protein
VNNDLLDSPALPLLLALEAAGVQFKVDGDEVLVSPRGVLTPGQRALFRAHRAAVKAIINISTDAGIQARRNTFRQQLEATAAPAVPAFLFKPGIAYVKGVCFSCGDGLPDVRFGRCWRCSLAWRLACRLPVPAALAVALDAARVA